MKLKTRKGSIVGRYNDVAGKLIGNRLYIERSSIDRLLRSIVDYDHIETKTDGKILAAIRFWRDATITLSLNMPEFEATYKCVCLDLKHPQIVRFDESPDFDTAREPIPGRMVTIDCSDGSVTQSYSNQIWHHKWCWVTDYYRRFNVKESYEWSSTWLARFDEPASGNEKKWNIQLSNVGLK